MKCRQCGNNIFNATFKSGQWYNQCQNCLWCNKKRKTGTGVTPSQSKAISRFVSVMNDFFGINIANDDVSQEMKGGWLYLRIKHDEGEEHKWYMASAVVGRRGGITLISYACYFDTHYRNKDRISQRLKK